MHDRCLEPFREAVRDHRIDTDLTPLLGGLYLPLAAWLQRRRTHSEDGLVVGLCGGQGSGKSTVADLLRVVLESGFGASVATLSIDDIYLTHDERQRLSREVHPLFATRGVPVTHDVDLGIRTIETLRGQPAGASVAIPSFDKSRDDRRPEADWTGFSGPADFVIFEGWCIGALPEDDATLAAPINALEQDEDGEGVWRKSVNEALRGPYRRLFGLIDVQLLLQVPGMEKVFEWRRLQEHKLAQKVAEAEPGASGLRIMSDAEVDRFVMHYERLTRNILAEMPQRADAVLPIDDSHCPAGVRINRPLD